MGRRSILMKKRAAQGGQEAESKADVYAAMHWPALQSLASDRGVLQRGMGRDEITAALLEADQAGE